MHPLENDMPLAVSLGASLLPVDPAALGQAVDPAGLLGGLVAALAGGGTATAAPDPSGSSFADDLKKMLDALAAGGAPPACAPALPAVEASPIQDQATQAVPIQSASA